MDEMDYQVDNDNEIRLSDLINIIKEKFWFIVAITLVFGLLLGGYAFFVAKPSYQSTGKVMVVVKTAADDTNSAESMRLLGTVAELMATDSVLERVVDDLGIQDKLTPSQIRSSLDITINQNVSLFVTVKFISKDRALTKEIVDSVIEQTIEFVNEEARLETFKDKIVPTDAGSSPRYHSPNRVLYAFVGLLLGGIVSLAIVFIREAMKSTIESKEQIERYLELQVLGVIPDLDLKEESKQWKEEKVSLN